MAKDVLNERRSEILDCIVRATRERGYPPTVREMARKSA